MSVMMTAPTAEIVDNTIDNRYVGKFEVFRDAPTGTKYYFRLRAVNGASLIVSSAYTSMNDVTVAISAVKAAANVDARFIKNDAALSFKVVNSNNVDVAFSDVYSSLAARDAGWKYENRCYYILFKGFLTMLLFFKCSFQVLRQFKRPRPMQSLSLSLG